MPTLASIVSSALDGVSTGITDVVLAVRVLTKQQGAWNSSAGRYDLTDSLVGTQGRCIFDTEKPVADVFPDSVPGSPQQLVFVEGVGVTPKEGQFLRVGSTDYAVDQVSDVLGVGSTFYVLVTEVQE